MANNTIHTNLKKFIQDGLVVSPWLMMKSQARFDAKLFTLIDHLAKELVDTYWTDVERSSSFPDIPIYDRIPQTALYEIIASTALSLAHNRFGDMEIRYEQVMDAVELLKKFITEFGFGSVLNIYWLVTSFENMQALHYYKKIPEQIFTMGTWHRPWVDYSLSDELFAGTYSGNYQIELINSKRYVTITEKGQETYQTDLKILEDIGYLDHRVRQLQIHNFTLYKEYSNIANEFWPNLHHLRKEFLKWSEIKPGMRVLELGCADGVSTFESGLADLIGESGKIISIDPSVGMIYRANKKKEVLNTNWVTFQNAKAEQLPCENESFDVVIAFSSLQFMDLHQALSEGCRVLKSGGEFISLHPLKFKMNDIMEEWFSPIVKLAKFSRNETPKDFLKHPEEIFNAFCEMGFVDVEENADEIINFHDDPETVANHLFRGVGWMLEELSMIPWKAREDIINEVIEQGKIVREKYSDEERMIRSPMQMIKGRKP